MRIELLVSFSNYDYIITGFNGTLEEAHNYYLNNTFTDVNENPITVMGVWLYDEFKVDVLHHCLENEIVALKFDDDQQLFTFKTKYNDLVTIPYEKTKRVRMDILRLFHNTEKMECKQGFYMIESLNNSNTRIALVWHNTKETKYGNETISKEVTDVVKLPKIIGKYLTRMDMENIGKTLMKDNNIKECAINFETVL